MPIACSFDSTLMGELYGRFDFSLPVALLVLASAGGVFLTFNERRRVWFSNSQQLK